MSALVLVSGFGPFEKHSENPSGALVERLSAQPPPGLDLRCAVLPVSFRRAPRAWDEELGQPSGNRPALALGLGVHGGGSFRLESGARTSLIDSEREDIDGSTAGAVHDAPGAPGSAGPSRNPTPLRRLASTLDVDNLALMMRETQSQDVALSHNAGGYVCERLYHHILMRGKEGEFPALFLHIPRVRFCTLTRQEQAVRALLAQILQ